MHPTLILWCNFFYLLRIHHFCTALYSEGGERGLILCHWVSVSDHSSSLWQQDRWLSRIFCRLIFVTSLKTQWCISSGNRFFFCAPESLLRLLKVSCMELLEFAVSSVTLSLDYFSFLTEPIHFLQYYCIRFMTAVYSLMLMFTSITVETQAISLGLSKEC